VHIIMSNMNLLTSAALAVLWLRQKLRSLQVVGLFLVFLSMITVKLDLFVEVPSCGQSATPRHLTRTTETDGIPLVRQNELQHIIDLETIVTSGPFLSHGLLASRPTARTVSSESESLELRNLAHTTQGTSRISVAGSDRFLAASILELTGDTRRFFLGALLAFLVAACSGLAGTATEWLFRGMDLNVSIWRKNIWIYQWGVMLNLLGCVFTFMAPTSTADPKHVGYAGPVDRLRNSLATFFHGWNERVILLTLSHILAGLVISIVFQRFGVIMKCVMKGFIISNVTLASYFWFGLPITAPFVVGVCVYLCGFAVYTDVTGEVSERVPAAQDRNKSEGPADEENLLEMKTLSQVEPKE
jgi:hypothetical protein